MVNFWRSLYLGIALFCMTTVCTAQTFYQVRDLGDGWWPNAVSNNRIVVGYRGVGTSRLIPIMWQNGRLSALPLPNDANDSSSWSVSATSINDTGELIVGDWNGDTGPYVLLWRNGRLEYPRINDNAIDVNNQGQILAGWSWPEGFYYSFLYYEDGSKVYFDDPATENVASWGRHLNNLGQVIGTQIVEEDNGHSGENFISDTLFLWENGDIYLLADLVDETVAYDESRGADINDLGQIIGNYRFEDDNGDTTSLGSFLIEAGNLYPIGDFNVSAINESAQVVGGKYLYDYDTMILRDLNGCLDPDDGWRFDSATDINDDGVIIGRGSLSSDAHALMLVPCETSTYFHDQDGDGYGDPQDTMLACRQPEEYIEAEDVEELVVNGTMEGESNWQDVRAPRINIRTEDHVHRGSYARYISANGERHGIKSETFRLTAGEEYRATLWVYGDGSTPLRASVFRNTDNYYEYLRNGHIPAPPAEWTRYSWSFTPNTSADHMFFAQIAPGGSSGEFYIDDVSVTRSVTTISDCNDNNRSINPSAVETCNGLDDDCDGSVDEGATTTYYRDTDGDGHGDPANTTEACTAPMGYLATAGDCDDDRPHIYLGAVEGCNGFDDDCDGDVDEDCIENELPVADAGSDQEVVEGETITLDGSGSMDSDDAIDTLQWAQIDGPTVVLSSDTADRPTFVTPSVTEEGAQLTFRLVVTDLKGALASDEVRVTIVDNNIGWTPDDVIAMQTVDGGAIGFKILEGGGLVAVEQVDLSLLTNDEDRPDDLIHGLLSLTIRSANNGDSAKIGCYLLEPLPDTYNVFAYTATEGWFKLESEANFNADRKQVVITATNGGKLDDNSSDNDFMKVLLAIGKELSRQTPEDPAPNDQSGSGGGGSGGCFIQGIDNK